MEQQKELCSHLSVGCDVKLALFEQGRAVTLHGEVVAEAPLEVRIKQATTSGIVLPHSVVIISQTENGVVRGDATATSCRETPTGLVLSFSEIEWEDLERRKYPRIAVGLTVALRTVQEFDGNAEVCNMNGTTADIGLGGAWVKTESQLEEGSLLEFQASLGDGTVVRTFGLVVHYDANRNGAGVAFLDFLGDSRGQLNEYLARAA